MKNFIKLAKILSSNGNTEAAQRVIKLIAQFNTPFLRENYDYSGESFYHGEMDRFKSVEDFLKKKKKKKDKKPSDLRLEPKQKVKKD